MTIKSLSDTDIIDIVKRLRIYINALDNIHWLTSKLEYLKDESITQSVAETMRTAEVAAVVSADLLKTVENSEAYKQIVIKYTGDLQSRIKEISNGRG